MLAALQQMVSFSVDQVNFFYKINKENLAWKNTKCFRKDLEATG